MRLRTASLAAAAAVIIATVLAVPASGAELGEPVRFSKGRSVATGPLTIEYLGERRVSHPVFKPGFTFHDFKVSDGRETKTISWSSGTGEVGPQEFSLSGTLYQLELRRSVAREGWLRDDELVLWRDVDYRKAAAGRRKQ